MSDHTDTTLTDTERADLLCADPECPECRETEAACLRIVAARVAAADREIADLRSRLACVDEATWWDRGYEERIAAIRGMCDLTTNGMTSTDDGEQTKADAVAAARAERDAEWERHLRILPDEMAEAWGLDAPWITTGNHVATLVGDWLSDLHYDLSPIGDRALIEGADQ